MTIYCKICKSEIKSLDLDFYKASIEIANMMVEHYRINHISAYTSFVQKVAEVNQLVPFLMLFTQMTMIDEDNTRLIDMIKERQTQIKTDIVNKALELMPLII